MKSQKDSVFYPDRDSTYRWTIEKFTKLSRGKWEHHAISDVFLMINDFRVLDDNLTVIGQKKDTNQTTYSSNLNMVSYNRYNLMTGGLIAVDSILISYASSGYRFDDNGFIAIRDASGKATYINLKGERFPIDDSVQNSTVYSQVYILSTDKYAIAHKNLPVHCLIHF